MIPSSTELGRRGGRGRGVVKGNLQQFHFFLEVVVVVVAVVVEKGSHRYTIIPAPIGIEPIISDNPLDCSSSSSSSSSSKKHRLVPKKPHFPLPHTFSNPYILINDKGWW